MTSERRFEQDLPELMNQLVVGPMPDYFDDIVQRTARTHQRPGWTFPERWVPMATFTARLTPVRQLPWRAMVVLGLLILGIVAAALLAGSQRRLAPAPPFGRAANGSIIYAANGDINVVDPVSKVSRLLVAGPEQDRDPVWSRDGTHFAFLRETSVGAEIYVAKSDGTNLTLMTPDPPLPRGVEFLFSPDGAELLVAIPCGSTFIAKTDGSGSRELKGVRTAGGPVPPAGPAGPAAAFRPPAGDRIAFVPCSEDTIGVVNPDGTGLRDVVGRKPPLQYGAPAWSPDGSMLAYHVWDGSAPTWTVRTHVMAADGTGDRAVDAAAEGDFDGSPVWSNDGKRVVIARGYGTDIYAVVMSADGSRGGIRSKAPLARGLACCSILEWAPDDSLVLVMPTDAAGVPTQQMLLDPNTGDIRPVPWTTNSQPSWQRLSR